MRHIYNLFSIFCGQSKTTKTLPHMRLTWDWRPHHVIRLSQLLLFYKWRKAVNRYPNFRRFAAWRRASMTKVQVRSLLACTPRKTALHKDAL
jgi:hypothetical protein